MAAQSAAGRPQRLRLCGKEEAPVDKVKHFPTGNASNMTVCRRRYGNSFKIYFFALIRATTWGRPYEEGLDDTFHPPGRAELRPYEMQENRPCVAAQSAAGRPQRLCLCGKEEAPVDKAKHFHTGNASNKTVNGGAERRRVPAKALPLWERGGTGRQGEAFPHRKCEQYDRVPTKVWQFIQNIFFRIDSGDHMGSPLRRRSG